VIHTFLIIVLKYSLIHSLKIHSLIKCMKNLLLLVVVAVLSSLATVFIHERMDNDEPERIIVREQAPSSPTPQYANLAASANTSAPKNLSKISTAPTSFIKGASKATPAVVHIRALQGRRTNGQFFDDFWGRTSNEVSSGSGVVISPDGYIVTNNHVIEDGNVLEVTLDGQRSLEAKVIGNDPSTDLALIKVEDTNMAHLNFADSDGAEIGEWVLAVGNPFNLNSTVTAGIISAKARNINILDDQYSIESFIQTDAAVNPGNSGGALVDTNGDLIGINTAIITRSGRYEGYSFAVPSNLVKKVVNDLREFGTVQRGFLGVNIQDISDEIASSLRLKSLDGVYLSRVNPGSAAENAGLRIGDVITSVNGNSVKSTPELQEQVAQFRPGDRVDVEYIRDGKRASTGVTLRNRNNNPTLMSKDNLVLTAQLGFDLRDLNKEEIRTLGMDGVRVTSIIRGSTIDYTNMQPDFIVTKINDVRVKELDGFMRILDGIKGKVVLEGFYESYPDVYFYNFMK